MIDHSTFVRSLRACAPWLVVALTLAAPPSDARAQDFYVGFGGGPTMPLTGGRTQLQLQQHIGFHVDGNAEGLYLEANLQQTFIGRRWNRHPADQFVFTLGGRVGYDIAVVSQRDFAFMLSPNGMGGVAFLFADGRDYAAFNLQAAFDLRFLVLDRFLTLWVRPFGISMFFGEFVDAGYDLLFGVSFNL